MPQAAAPSSTVCDRSDALPGFQLPDLQLIAAARLPAGAVLSLDSEPDFAAEMADLVVEVPCSTWGIVQRRLASFYPEGDGVRVDVGTGDEPGSRSVLVANVAAALGVVLALLPAA